MELKRNLVYQYYIPYQGNDKDMGSERMPKWAQVGSFNAHWYAYKNNAEYMLRTDRVYPHLDPRLESTRIIFDSEFDQYDTIISMDLDMMFTTSESLFEKPIEYLGMVHEKNIHTRKAGWLSTIMDRPVEQRGIIAYAKTIFGKDFQFPKSSLYPEERYRYLNGGLQVWTKEGRKKARREFYRPDHYYKTIRRTEQPYLNIMLTGFNFPVTELPQEWNSMDYQWGQKMNGKLIHFLNRTKFTMEKLHVQYN